MEVGDLVTGYYKGIYEVTRVQRRWLNKNLETTYQQQAYCIMDTYTPECGEEMNSLIYGIQKFTAEGKPYKTTQERCWDAGFSESAQTFIQKEIERVKTVVEQLETVARIIKQ